MMHAIPSSYFCYYYFRDEMLAELRGKPTTRAQDIMAHVADYWRHYEEQAEQSEPRLDPSKSWGGIHELELAFDVMDALFNDRKEVWPVNVPNHGAMTDFPDNLVVEVPEYVDRHGIVPLSQPPLPHHVAGLVKALAEYQLVAAEAAWQGTRDDAIRALATHPWIPSLHVAQRLYDEMASLLRPYLPERLLQ
ncbi:MAG: hypothetical protein OWU33_00995 [Firmicutes bacterium]|nr:hypothetical protein [Bacillota bacterium]